MPEVHGAQLVAQPRHAPPVRCARRGRTGGAPSDRRRARPRVRSAAAPCSLSDDVAPVTRLPMADTSRRRPASALPGDVLQQPRVVGALAALQFAAPATRAAYRCTGAATGPGGNRRGSLHRPSSRAGTADTCLRPPGPPAACRTRVVRYDQSGQVLEPARRVPVAVEHDVLAELRNALLRSLQLPRERDIEAVENRGEDETSRKTRTITAALLSGWLSRWVRRRRRRRRARAET